MNFMLAGGAASTQLYLRRVRPM